jgi:AcrR family transcriptional regulator
MTTGEGADDSIEEIMEATYRALCAHGYPATTIAKIADEFEKSKSLLYYHYEDKEDLLEDFLRYLLDQFETDLASIDESDPPAHLRAVLDRLLPHDIDDEGLRFRRAIFEIRSQAPYHDIYRQQFQRSDQLILDELVETIERGIDSGVFRPVNSRQVAEFIISTAYGAVERGVTLEDPTLIEDGRETIDAYVDSHVRSYA